jgi:hypothetical protein
VVRIYIESDNGHFKSLAQDLHGALIETSEDYKTAFGITGGNPVRVSTLMPGTFKAYTDAKRAEGAELGHLKPPRLQPSEIVMKQLLELSGHNGKGQA